MTDAALLPVPDGNDAEPWPLPEPCARCGEGERGLLERGDVHDKLTCAACGAYQKFLSKRVTGSPRRSMRTRDGIKQRQRERILERDGARCMLCGSTDNLEAGHILSDADATTLAIPADQIDSDANLMAMCERCNSGLSRHSLTPWLYVALLNRRHTDETS